MAAPDSPVPPPPCPVCGSTGLVARGPILHPQPPRVAGVAIDLGTTSFALWRCRQCAFQFKAPGIEASRLMACYAAAKSDAWGIDPDPWQRQFDVIEAMLVRHAHGPRVLDVGCSNGALLKFLGDRWQRFGIEPSRAAAATARDRGIEVLAASWESLDPEVAPFDAILALDVIEHIAHPMEFFRQAATRLKPGGIFMCLTGNTDALAWRLQGSHYWYCSLPEHLSFFNQQSIHALAQRSGLHNVATLTLGHKRLSRLYWAADMTKCAAYLVGRAVGGFGLPALRRHVVDRRGPTIQSAQDHLLAVLRRA